MKEAVGSVSTKGQVTIPQEFRERLGIRPGDKVRISIEDTTIVLRLTDVSLRAGYRSIPALKRPLTDDQINDLAALAAVEDLTGTKVHQD
jgi:AbrB family looped-hinge helix DNA binding protein